MRMDEDWWKARWDGSEYQKPPFAEEAFDGQVDLTVATVPYAMFQFFYDWMPLNFGCTIKELKRAMKAFGWQEEQHNDLGFHHKYLDVYHSELGLRPSEVV